MTDTISSPVSSSCGHDFDRDAECFCSADIARFGRHGGWDDRIARIGTLAVLRRLRASGLLSRRKLLAEMRLRGFSDEDLSQLDALIEKVLARDDSSAGSAR